MFLKKEKLNIDCWINKEKLKDTLEHKIKIFLNEAIEKKAFPGAVVIAGDGEKQILKIAVGRTTYSSDSQKVGIDTIYDLASLAKIFTLTGALILASKNEINLDKEINYFLKTDNFPKVTLRHLLTHTSGLKLSLSSLKNFPPEQIEKEIFSHGPKTEPGTECYYSNQGYFILGEILERVTKKRLDSFFRDSIFIPLRMNSTGFNPPKEWKKKIAPTEDDPWRGGLIWGETHDEIAYKTGGIAGHAGLFSNGEDLFKLGQLWLGGGTFEGKQLIKRNFISQATTGNFPEAIDGTGIYAQHFGLGWRLENRKFIGHLASKNTYNFSGFTGPSLMVDPEKELIVVIMNNRIHPSRTGPDWILFHAKITEEIYRSLFL